MTESITLKQARPSEQEFDALGKFLHDLFEKAEDVDLSDIGLRRWILRHGPLECSVDRVLWGGRTAIANACDPSCSTLEWKPEIAAALAAAR